jgi:uncharacterized protein (TIGR00369 family)
MIDHYRRLEAMYVGAPINQIYKPRITVGEGSADIYMQATESLHHAGHGLHGSVFFKMLDDAAFFAVASQVTDAFIVTASFHVSFLRGITTGELHSMGRVIRMSSSVCVAESILYGADGREAARGMGDFVRSKTRLAAELGYR